MNSSNRAVEVNVVVRGSTLTNPLSQKDVAKGVALGIVLYVERAEKGLRRKLNNRCVDEHINT